MKMRFLQLILLAGLMLTSCKSISVLSGTNIDMPTLMDEDLNRFLLSFEKKVKKSRSNHLFEYIDNEYQVEQLQNLEGRKSQFIQEMFCGKSVKDQSFICIDLKKIKNIQLEDLIPIDIDMYRAIYRITSEQGMIITVEWMLVKSMFNPIYGFGFVGAYG